MEHLFPEDDPQKDTDKQKEVRRQTEQPINTADDKEFTQDEVMHLVEGFKYKTAPELNGLTNGIDKLIFQAIRRTMAQLYNVCLKSRHFPEKMEESNSPNNCQTQDRWTHRRVNVQTY